MPKQNKSYSLFSARLDNSAAEEIDALHREIGLSKTMIVEKAIHMFFAYYKSTGRIGYHNNEGGNANVHATIDQVPK